MVEITAKEQNKGKEVKIIVDTLRDLWDNIKHSDIRVIGVSEEEEKKKGNKKIFEEIAVDNFTNTRKVIVIQGQEAQRAPCRLNPRGNTLRY